MRKKKGHTQCWAGFTKTKQSKSNRKQNKVKKPKKQKTLQINWFQICLHISEISEH